MSGDQRLRGYNAQKGDIQELSELIRSVKEDLKLWIMLSILVQAIIMFVILETFLP